MLMVLWVESSVAQVLELDIQWTDSPCVHVVISTPPVSLPRSFAISAVGMLQPVTVGCCGVTQPDIPELLSTGTTL